MGFDSQARLVAEGAKSDFDVRGLIQLLLRQKWTILSVFTVVIVLTVFITLSLPKVFQASTTLEYDPSPSRPLGSGVEDPAQPAGSFLIGKEWYQTQNTIIASRTVATKVVEKLALHRDPGFMGVPTERRAGWAGATIDEAVKQLLNVVTVKQEKDTRVARIEVKDGDARRAALLANAVADAYMDWVMEERLASTVRAVEWLSGQLDDVSKRLQSSELALHEFRRTNNVLSVSLADQQNGITQTIHRLSEAVTDATARRIQVEAKLDQLEKALAADPMLVHAQLVSDSAAVAELRRRYHDAVVQRDELATTYGPNHPEMRKVQGRIDALVVAARSEIQALVDSQRSSLAEAKQVERGLRSVRQETQDQGLDLNLHEIEYNRLERERANTEKLHGLLLQRTTETNLTRLLRVSPVRLVDRAAVPQDPIRPRPVLNIAVGVLIGLLGGLGFALLRARMDRSVTSPDDVAALGATLLGILPGILNEKSPGGPQGKRARGRRREAAQLTARNKDLVVHTHPHSSAAECCRTIRTNLAFMSTDSALRTLAVTSPGPGEGKSTVATSLAITMAQGGRRVVLVDTDLRRPRLHKAFSVRSQGGVTSVLAGEVSLEASLCVTDIDGVTLLPCGPIPPNPSELLHTAGFSRLLEELKGRFDVVILDSPPVGVVIDAAVIGPQVDGVVMVAKSGQTSRDALGQALRQMRDVGSKVLGCVLNDVDLSRQGYYGGYYYRGGYYYANRDDGNDGDGDGGEGRAAPRPSVA